MANLSKIKSVQIAEEFLQVFTAFCNDVSLYFFTFPIIGYEQNDEEIENLKEYVTYEWNSKKTGQLLMRKNIVETEADIFEHNTYILLHNNRKYKMNMYDSPEACGYICITEDEENESRHLFCVINELRENGTLRYSMGFDFDIVDMTLLDITYIEHTNIHKCVRECEEIKEVVSEFVGRKLREVEFPKLQKE